MLVRVESLESNVKLLNQLLLLQDNVLATELLDCKKHDEIGID